MTEIADATPGYSLRLARWTNDMHPIREVRTEVFIEEQHVPPEEEWDGLDAEAVHALAFDDEHDAIATGRLLHDGRIGRMAVCKPWRGKGIGTALLKLLMDEARARGHASVTLAAQVHAIPFYEKFGFKAHGEEFMDAGIPHYWMKADLAPTSEGK